MASEPLNAAELSDLRKLVAADPSGFIPVPATVLLRLIRWQSQSTTHWKSGPFKENITDTTIRNLHEAAIAKGLVLMGDGPLSDVYITKEEKARLDQQMYDFAGVERRALASVKCELCYDTGFTHRINGKDVPCVCDAGKT